ncbi:hypothetical protein [Dictyobacter aurantiacus]|uniref:MASE1 domain-containing protein n=1 Tax=Dictyobacter aurantiacus TaxID=1936993 RepID=A0A401ZQL0_9CHLR|nr:hypothetical protein [Dictyobacter aurantiacus]GCE09100.1 hypothetical protein KDAU_64290 [Dictyobacter aurantiacus]
MEDSLKRSDNVEVNRNYPDEPPAIEGSASTSIRYTFRFTGWPSLSQLVAVAVATAVYTVLSWLGVVTLPGPAFGVSTIFIAIGFGLPFALWFGGWAFVIAYIGNFVGAGLLSGIPVLVAIPFGAADFIQLCIPMLLYRFLAYRFGVSPVGKDVFTLRGFIFFLLCAVIPNNIIGGLYGNLVLLLTGQEPANAFIPGWVTWSGVNIIIVLVIGSILLSTLTPIVERFGLTIRDALR